MDFRRVEPKFRRVALIVQVILCSFLICYVGLSLKQIGDSSTDPPVETRTIHWKKNLGVWALCAFKKEELFGVGTGIEDSPENLHNNTERKAALTGVQLSPPQMISISPELERNCTIMDLTDVDVNYPLHFTLCVDGGFRSRLYVKTADSWEFINGGSVGSLKWLSLSRSVHGWNYGYTTTEYSIFSTSSIDGPWVGGDMTHRCAAGMKYFRSPGYTTMAVSFSMKSPVVVAHSKQGMMPQMFKLLSSMGGYMALLSFLYTCFFVKLYPESPVAQIYESRTFVLRKILSYMLQDKKNNETDTAVGPVPLRLPPGMFKELERDTE